MTGKAFSPATMGIQLPSQPWATINTDLPPADNGGMIVYSPDAPGGAGVVVSNGIIWLSAATISTAKGTLLTTTAAKTVANSTVETSVVATSIIGSPTMAAGFWVPGKAIFVSGGGVFSTAALLPTLTVRTKLNTTTIASGNAANLISNAANNAYHFEQVIKCESVVGSVATMRVDGKLDYATTAGARSFIDLNNTGATFTVDPTVSQTYDATIQWGTASASNTLTASYSIIEQLN